MAELQGLALRIFRCDLGDVLRPIDPLFNVRISCITRRNPFSPFSYHRRRTKIRAKRKIYYSHNREKFE